MYSEVQKWIPKNVPNFEPSNNDLHNNRKKRNEKIKWNKKICHMKANTKNIAYNVVHIQNKYSGLYV